MPGDVIFEGCSVGFNRISPIKADVITEEGNLGIVTRVTDDDIFIAVSAVDSKNSVSLAIGEQFTQIAFVKVARNAVSLMPSDLFLPPSQGQLDCLKQALKDYERQFSI
jgi:hypothetical protein